MKKFVIAILMIAPLSMNAQKFAHFNSADIISNMKEYVTATEEIQAMAKQYEDDMKLMQEELQDLYQRLQQSYQDNQQALEKARMEKMGAINEKVMAAVKKIGEAGGYIYVVDLNTGAIPFVNSQLSTDVTDLIKKEVGIQ